MAIGKPPGDAERAAIIAALPRLRRFCWALTGTATDGEDLMQATVERALGRIDQFEAGTRMDSWLFRIARNLRIDGARSQTRRGSPVSLDDLPEREGIDGLALVENRSELAAAQRALAALPDDQRETFVLVVIEGLSYRDAAEVLEVPPGTVMSRLARARDKIDAIIGRGNRGLQ